MPSVIKSASALLVTFCACPFVFSIEFLISFSPSGVDAISSSPFFYVIFNSFIKFTNKRMY